MKIYIIYELRSREYDTALLLKSELEARGYFVKIINKQMMFKWFYNDSIIIIPNCYNTLNYDYYNYSLNAKNNFFVNLQIEQVLSEKNEENGFCNPKGKATLPVHCCWGENTYNRLLNNGVEDSNLRITGAIHLDFLREEFRDFWYSRNDIAKMYNIPPDKKWVLYISSFSYVNNEEVVKLVQKDFGGEKASYIKEFEKVSTESHKITLDWLEKLVSENEDIIVIYRPHPAEKQHSRLENIQNEYQGKFYSISELNIKQWLLVSNQVITWFSTSIVESYAAKKMCHILRPISIPKEIDAKIYHEAKNIINSYEELNELVSEQITKTEFDEKNFPINKDDMINYYLMDNRAALKKTLDLIDELSNKNKNKIEDNYNFNRMKYILKNNIALKYYMKRIYSLCYKRFGFTIKSETLRKRWAFENLEYEVDNDIFNRQDENRKLSLLSSIIVNLK
ncbi:surface carbohydrate biosynthesis protein [Trichococcus alkaliphilus]|uniref:surface carbohydrate biosynthesis protein n=1 Tax=Trichococcus alkaliphilus TaxID=2052943 RepID=UPI000D0AD7B6|nr:surface carbohydrate biosynthesis protein [Trichococcus alkaliphilus]